MTDIRIICVGKLKEKFYSAAADEYVKRLGGYCKLTLLELNEERLGDRLHYLAGGMSIEI